MCAHSVSRSREDAGRSERALLQKGDGVKTAAARQSRLHMIHGLCAALCAFCKLLSTNLLADIRLRHELHHWQTLQHKAPSQTRTIEYIASRLHEQPTTT